MSNRREFLRKGVAGLSGAALLPAAFGSSPWRSNDLNDGQVIPSRMLGKTGIMTPMISMGTSGTSNTGFIRAAYEAGVRLFFSATYYGEGNNEILVGEGLKELPRETFLVGTASWPAELDRRTGSLTGKFDSAAFIRKAEESLKRFGIETIDFILLPYASKREVILHDGILDTMQRLKKEGKVRFTGIASHSGTVEALNAVADTDVYDVAMIAYNYRIQNREEMDSAIAKAAGKGVGIIGMKSTAGVFREKSGPQADSNALLKWVLSNRNVSTIVSGMSTLDQLKKNIAMLADLKLSEEEEKELKMLADVSYNGLYCQQCRECVPQCPNNLEIPTLMRGYMYAYGYKDISKAWHTVSEAGIKNDPCGNCPDCNVMCSSGFDIRARVSDISRLAEVPYDFIKA